jgi:hypothetical protein
MIPQPPLSLPDLHAPRRIWAHYYAARDWPVFPCRGKTPLTPHGFHDASRDPAAIDAWWGQWPEANIGSPAGLQWWALDVDPRAGGDATLFNLQQQHGRLPRTLLSHTGGGGNHYLWALLSGLAVINKAHLGDGLDVQAAGSYVILPNSLHPDTGNTYVWDLVDGPEDLPPQPAPDWLLALVTQPAVQGIAPAALPAVDAPIPEGERDKTLAHYGAMMAHAGLGADAIRAALGIMNQRCVPPLSEADLNRIAHSTSRYQRPVMLLGGSSVPPPGWSMNGTGHTPPLASPGWRTHLHAKKHGGLVQDVGNVSLILEHHEYFRGQLWWDDVRSRPMFGGMIIDDDTIVGIARWLGTEETLSVTNLRLVERCVLSRCRVNKRDLLQAWLLQLPAWDGIPRLSTWLTTYAGVEPTAYGQDVARVLILEMIARAFEPGCLCRYVVILEGPEGCGKSTLVQALAGDDWYVVLSIGLETKDAHMMLQGVWVAEMAELDSLSRTEETRLKAFITMGHDSYIPKYSNFRASYPRRAIFMGTTNEESYLKGQTGNTRFLPVKVTKQIDVDGFRAIRNQLFAEALTLYCSGTPWWQMSPEGDAAAQEERERRRLVNVYEEGLEAWLETERFTLVALDNNQPVRFVKNETSWMEIARWFLKLQTPAEWKDKGLQMQIAQALKALGWHVFPTTRQGRRVKLWVKTPQSRGGTW